VQRADLIDFKRMYGKVPSLDFKAQRFNPHPDDESVSSLGMATWAIDAARRSLIRRNF